MANHAVHWAEGLFLRPHHFQTAERNLREELLLSEDWNVGYSYGLRKIDIDADALANWRILLRTCHIRLHDGTHLRFPEDAALDPITLPRDILQTPDDRAMVYVAVPRLQRGRRNADQIGGDSNARYWVESQEVEDENQGGYAQTLQVRRLNARLVIGEERISGYEALPVMRLRLGARAEAPPEIDPDYIPPILACDAWPILGEQVIDKIYNQLGGVTDRLARQMVDRGVAFESGHREDIERILKLQSLNTALGYLTNLPFVRGVHPLVAYMELCRVVGLLAIFLQSDRRMPEVPRYDHDDLARCFYAIRQLLLRIDVDRIEDYIKRPFIGSRLQMRVRLDGEWIDSPNWIFFIGVECSLPPQQVDAQLKRLDMKVGSSERVDDIYLRGQSGVRLILEPEAPRSLPPPNWTYYKVDRDSEAWKEVGKTLNLAIRFNERQVEGGIDQQQEVRIKTEDGRLVRMSFALFAMQVQRTP